MNLTPQIPAKFRPMKAATAEIGKLKFPMYASPKIDGYRNWQAPTVDSSGAILGSVPLSNTLKPLPNPFVNDVLSHPILADMDGELTVGPAHAKDLIGRCGELRREYGEPEFAFHVFDLRIEGHGFEERQRLLWLRIAEMREAAANGDEVMQRLANHVLPVYQTRIDSHGMLDQYESAALRKGFEGVMLRKPTGEYKYGRSTMREQGLVKVKRFADMEAEWVSCEPAYENLNEKEVNALGLSERSTRKDGKVEKEMIGRIVVRELTGDKREFGIGPGEMTHADRIALWTVRDSLPGSIVKLKHFPHGQKDLPRHGLFLCFRHPDDM